jgi:hypothetical protein
MTSDGLNRNLILTSIVALRREIEAILPDTSGQEDSASLPMTEAITDQIEHLIQAARRGDVPQAAERVISLLSLNLDDLRKAALLSLIVRLTGKRNFDPVAAYVLEKRAAYVTSPG